MAEAQASLPEVVTIIPAGTGLQKTEEVMQGVVATSILGVSAVCFMFMRTSIFFFRFFFWSNFRVIFFAIRHLTFFLATLPMQSRYLSLFVCLLFFSNLDISAFVVCLFVILVFYSSRFVFGVFVYTLHVSFVLFSGLFFCFQFVFVFLSSLECSRDFSDICCY